MHLSMYIMPVGRGQARGWVLTQLPCLGGLPDVSYPRRFLSKTIRTQDVLYPRRFVPSQQTFRTCGHFVPSRDVSFPLIKVFTELNLTIKKIFMELNSKLIKVSMELNLTIKKNFHETILETNKSFHGIGTSGRNIQTVVRGAGRQ